ncbi:MutS-related protein [Pseudorhodoferax sp.]|uniref:MutS-related protein n=1 Tax=Pseudorhodoferax sp. TaxID=1993553 RepID=UPI0039E3AFFD
MKALLMHPDRDFDGEQPVPGHADTLSQDLELPTLWTAMAGEDDFLREVARKAILLAPGNDAATVRHRQQVLADALAHPQEVRTLYALAVDAIEGRRKFWFGAFMNYPSGILRSTVDVMQFFAGMLRKLRLFAEREGRAFGSPGFSALFAMLRAECDDGYLATVQRHLQALRFEGGVLISASLGRGNEGIGHVLRQPPEKPPLWERWFHRGPPQFGFQLHERDEAGARMLGDIEDRGVNLVANALAQSCDHVLGFFQMLRTELAFYVTCLHLHEKLAAAQAPWCLPGMAETGSLQFSCADLRDACLVLQMGPAVVGNTVAADGHGLIVVTGANQGGKSSFLRACGLAQLMMQAGMFVCARAYAGERCTGLFTHYKREEDASLKSGKLDEELARLSGIAGAIRPGCLFLSNESFASTNEREGSEIARQTVDALSARRIKVIAVTHLFDFAHRLAAQRRADALFLRAGRREDGARSFQLAVGEPLSTSFGQDLYAQVFGAAAAPA